LLSQDLKFLHQNGIHQHLHLHQNGKLKIVKIWTGLSEYRILYYREKL